MARIRSIHPGIFTDDAYMSLSFPARELLKGIWCECDDAGVFEWRPLTLKARILPADSVDTDALLQELERAEFIRKFTTNDKAYGAVRNFGRYQRPKKPSYTYPLPENLADYVAKGFKRGASNDDEFGTSSEPVPHQDGTGGEKSGQMEDGGGKKEVKKKENRGADAHADFAFVGRVIRLSRDDYDKWRRAYCNIRNLNAELQAADDYYAENPPKDGKWFFPVSNWLKRSHEQNRPKVGL